MGKSENNISAEELWEGIQKMAAGLGFADCGCAHLAPLSGSREEKRYREAEQMGHFGKMEYLKRNVDKRMDPSLLLPDAKSVIDNARTLGSYWRRRSNAQALERR